MNAVAMALSPGDTVANLEEDESVLVQGAQKGDIRSFEALYRLHIGRVYAVCFRLAGGNRGVAEELAQDAFVRAWEKLASFQMNSAFGTWLHRLTVNYVLSEKRKWARRREMERSTEEIAVEPGRVDPVDGLDQDLEAAISKLPERARTVLVLHDIEGYQHNEISELADMAVGTSKAQLHRARKLLQEMLDHG